VVTHSPLLPALQVAYPRPQLYSASRLLIAETLFENACLILCLLSHLYRQVRHYPRLQLYAPPREAIRSTLRVKACRMFVSFTDVVGLQILP